MIYFIFKVNSLPRHEKKTRVIIVSGVPRVTDNKTHHYIK